MDDPEENPNPTYYDDLLRRQKVMERGLVSCDLPDPEIMSHAHVTVRGSMTHLLFWFADPITKDRRFVRVAVPYGHFLLCARGIVDAHDEQEMYREMYQSDPNE